MFSKNDAVGKESIPRVLGMDSASFSAPGTGVPTGTPKRTKGVGGQLDEDQEEGFGQKETGEEFRWEGESHMDRRREHVKNNGHHKMK